MSTAIADSLDLATVTPVIDAYLHGAGGTRRDVIACIRRIGKSHYGWNLKRSGLEFGLPESEEEETASLIMLRLLMANVPRASTNLQATLTSLCAVSRALHRFEISEVDLKTVRHTVSQATASLEQEIPRILCRNLEYTFSMYNAPGTDGKDTAEVLAMCIATADRIADYWRALLF